MPTPPHLAEALSQRQQQGLLRQLGAGLEGVDLYSNDYLGLARSPQLHQQIQQALADRGLLGHGATGARLLSGGTDLALELEAELAKHFKAEAALLFNSGYVANIGLLQAISRRQDLVLYDTLCHTSLREGIRLGLGKNYAFRHNDLSHLADLLTRHQPSITQQGGVIYIVVESLYSMDGDMAPLQAMVNLAQQFGAYLIVDEAHSTGLFGPDQSPSQTNHYGAGLVVRLGLEPYFFARIHTFGKAFGAHGACVVGADSLIQYLVNFSRSFVYTTMMPAHGLMAIRESLQIQNGQSIAAGYLQLRFWDIVAIWQRLVATAGLEVVSAHSGPIQTILTPGNVRARSVAQQLQQAGFAVKPVLSPTVPKGQERIRICLHNYNTEGELSQLLQTCAKFLLAT